MRLLSVDWDYFVPSVTEESLETPSGSVPYGRDMGEYFPDDMLDALWDSRAAALLEKGGQLPGTSGEEQDFWHRFEIAPPAVLFYADSHAQAAHARVREGITEVWNYDAHHDCGYEGALDDVGRLGWVGCANWMCFYALAGAELHVRYPAWLSDEAAREWPPLCPVDCGNGDPAVPFDIVFVARSGTWTPPWLDGALTAFLEAAPVARRVCLDPVWRRRQMDMGWVRHLQELVVN